jgi:hypothetical protein
MPQIETGDAGKLVFHQPLAPVTRVILGLGGALALSAPHELLIRPGVPLFQLGMIPFWILGVIAGLIGATLLLAAVLGLTRTITFDAAARALFVDGNGSFGIGWRARYTFSDILELNVIPDTSSGGPDRYVLHAVVANAKGPVEIDTFGTELAALEARAKIEALMLGDEI